MMPCRLFVLMRRIDAMANLMPKLVSIFCSIDVLVFWYTICARFLCIRHVIGNIFPLLALSMFHYFIEMCWFFWYPICAGFFV